MKIRLLSSFRKEINAGPFRFSTRISGDEADALLCEWEPQDELISFAGAKAWYCCEPSSSVLYRSQTWRRIQKQLMPAEFLSHFNPDPVCRVPHITLEGNVVEYDRDKRIDKAVAIISNTGGNPWTRSSHQFLRLKFATHNDVDLFGSRKAWQNYRPRRFGRRGLPQNYQGELPGFWSSGDRFEQLARYKVAVCLENTFEPNYFTEKLPGAIQSGCIPIYRAHPSVRNGVLRGAAWVDPGDFDNNVDETIAHALDEDPVKYQTINSAWLHGQRARATHAVSVFRRIGEILELQSAHRPKAVA